MILFTGLWTWHLDSTWFLIFAWFLAFVFKYRTHTCSLRGWVWKYSLFFSFWKNLRSAGANVSSNIWTLRGNHWGLSTPVVQFLAAKSVFVCLFVFTNYESVQIFYFFMLFVIKSFLAISCNPYFCGVNWNNSSCFCFVLVFLFKFFNLIHHFVQKKLKKKLFHWIFSCSS